MLGFTAGYPPFSKAPLPSSAWVVPLMLQNTPMEAHCQENHGINAGYWLFWAGIVAHSKTEGWLTLTGQVAQNGQDYSYLEIYKILPYSFLLRGYRSNLLKVVLFHCLPYIVTTIWGRKSDHLSDLIYLISPASLFLGRRLHDLVVCAVLKSFLLVSCSAFLENC